MFTLNRRTLKIKKELLRPAQTTPHPDKTPRQIVGSSHPDIFMPRYGHEEIIHNIKPHAGCADRKYRGELC